MIAKKNSELKKEILKIEIQTVKEQNIFDLLYADFKIMGDFGSIAYSLCRLQDAFEDFQKRKIQELEKGRVK